MTNIDREYGKKVINFENFLKNYFKKFLIMLETINTN